MPRYARRITHPRASWMDDDPLIPSLQVDMAAPEDTGIVDAEGYQLLRYADEIGFLRGLAAKKMTER